MIVKIAICDDEQIYIEQVVKKVNKFYQRLQVPIQTFVYKTGKQMLEAINTLTFDLVILDIEMDYITGIFIGKKIRRYDRKTEIIYFTNHMGYIDKTYDIEALGYVLKIHSETKFDRMLEKSYGIIKQKYEQELDSQKTLKIISYYMPTAILYQEIIYIEKYRNQAIVYTIQKKAYPCYETITELLKRLDSNQFVKVSGSTIVNWRYVENMKHYQMIIKSPVGELQLSVSRKLYANIKKDLIKIKSTY